MSNKFAKALNTKKVSNTHKVVNEDVLETEMPKAKAVSKISPHDRPSRKNTKHIGGYYSHDVSKQLRMIGLDEDKSVQDLLAEALDMLFQSRQKPTIAQKPGVHQ